MHGATHTHTHTHQAHTHHSHTQRATHTEPHTHTPRTHTRTQATDTSKIKPMRVRALPEQRSYVYGLICPARAEQKCVAVDRGERDTGPASGREGRGGRGQRTPEVLELAARVKDRVAGGVVTVVALVPTQGRAW